MAYTPGAIRICKICGKEYPYCHTNIADQYRWQDVACCKEHAAQYFVKIAESRGQSLDTVPDEFTALLPKTVEKKVEDSVLKIFEDTVDDSDGLDGIAVGTTAEKPFKSKKKFKK